jgi:WD40 repeat protein
LHFPLELGLMNGLSDLSHRGPVMLSRTVFAAVTVAWAIAPVAAQPSAAKPRLDFYGDPLPEGAVARLGSTRLRPGGWIRALAFSPDNRRLASWSQVVGEGSRLQIWDVADGRELRRSELPNAQLAELRWLANGRGIAVLWYNRTTLYVWDFTDEQAPAPPIFPVAQTYALEIGDTTGVAISPDGRWLAVGHRAQTNELEPVEVCELETNKKLSDLKTHALGQQPGHGCNLTFSPDSQLLFAFSRTQGPMRKLPAVNGVEGRTEPGDFSKESHLVVREVATGRERVSFDVPAVAGERYLPGPNSQESLAMPNSQTVVTGHEDGTIRVWDWLAKKELGAIAAHRADIRLPLLGGPQAICLSADGKTLASFGYREGIRRWDLAKLKEINPVEPRSQRITTIALSSDNTCLAATELSGSIRIWNLATGQLRYSETGHTEHIDAICAVPGGAAVMTASSDGTVRTWDIENGTLSHSLALKGSPYWDTCAFSSDGRELIARGSSGRLDLRYWDVCNGNDQSLVTISGKNRAIQKEIRDLILDGRSRILGTPGQATVVLQSSLNKISLVDWRAGKVHVTLTQLREPGSSLSLFFPRTSSVSSDQRTVAILGDDSREKLWKQCFFGLWNTDSGDAIVNWTTADSIYQSAVFTPDNSAIVLAGGPKFVYGDEKSQTKARRALILVNSATGTSVREFVPEKIDPDDQRRIDSVAISEDGRQLAAAERDHSIWVYELASGQIRGKRAGHDHTVKSLAFTPDGARLISAGNDLNALVWNVSLTSLGLVGPKPRAEDADRLWADLGNLEWKTAGAAAATLAAFPDFAIALMRDRLKVPDFGRMNQLIAQLDSPKFTEREQATNDLRDIGVDIRRELQRRANAAASPEVRARLTKIIDELAKPKAKALLQKPEGLREIRAVEILEQIGTDAARGVLSGCATKFPGSALADDATAALTRLEKR